MPPLLAVLFVPPLISGGACLAFARRLAPSRARTRFFGVGLSMVLLFATALAFELPGGAAGPWMLVGLGTVLLAAIAVITAYEPPGWLRRALDARA